MSPVCGIFTLDFDVKFKFHTLYNGHCTSCKIHTAHLEQYTRHTCTIHTACLAQYTLQTLLVGCLNSIPAQILRFRFKQKNIFHYTRLNSSHNPWIPLFYWYTYIMFRYQWQGCVSGWCEKCLKCPGNYTYRMDCVKRCS